MVPIYKETFVNNTFTTINKLLLITEEIKSMELL